MTSNKEADPAAPPAGDEAGLSPQVVQALQAVQKAMEDLAGLLGADSAATLDALKQAGRAASENLGGIANDARDRSRETLDDLSESVRRHPLSWLAAALGAGLVIGLWRNRGDRS
jgi:hypothetical protein